MSLLQQAKELVRNYPFSQDALENYTKEKEGLFGTQEFKDTYYNGENTKPYKVLTPEILAESFHYIIQFEDKEALEEGQKLGYSKKHGYPHLPDNWVMPEEWNDEYAFWVQLNIEEIKPYDVENIFPDKGILYFFQHKDEGDCHVLYYDGPMDDISEREDIDCFESEEEVRISFIPTFLFYIGGDAYEYTEIYSFIPSDLKQQLEQLLKCSMAKYQSDERLLGRPVYWQGEDEDYSEVYGKGNEEELTQEDGKNDILLLHITSESDTTFHIWINKKDLKEGVFNKAYETFSGT